MDAKRILLQAHIAHRGDADIVAARLDNPLLRFRKARLIGIE